MYTVCTIHSDNLLYNVFAVGIQDILPFYNIRKLINISKKIVLVNITKRNQIIFIKMLSVFGLFVFQDLSGAKFTFT